MKSVYVEAEMLQNMLVSQATGGVEDESEYTRLRQILLAQSLMENQIPRFVQTCRSLSQFWQFIKQKFGTYAERRAYLWDEFRPLLEKLENDRETPSDTIVTLALEKFDSANIQAVWAKAIERRTSDPEGAITIARTLLESVCKHILEEANSTFDNSPDLSKLYRQTSDVLNIAPSQHTEQVFKQILGGCTSVVEGLGALRNRLSDAHGKGKIGVKPAPRHAELAVNLSGALAIFLIATWESRGKI